MAVIRESGYRNVYARWVPKMLTVEQKTAPKTPAHNFSSAVRKTQMPFGRQQLPVMKPWSIIMTH